MLICPNQYKTLNLFKCTHMIVESYNLYQTALELSNLIDQKLIILFRRAGLTIMLAAMCYVTQVVCMKVS